MMDFLHDGDRRRHGETAATVFLGNERGEKASLGQRLDEFRRIGALAIDLAPILAGEFRANRPHRLPDWRQLGLVGGARGHALDLGPAVAHRHDIALGNECPEAYDIAIAPDFGADRLARKHRRREPPAHGGEAARIVIANALQQRMADHAEGAEPVQDRPRKARGLGHVEIGVQRIEIGGEPIDQRHLRPRAEIADQIGRALGHLVRAAGFRAADRRSRHRRGKMWSA